MSNVVRLSDVVESEVLEEMTDMANANTIIGLEGDDATDYIDREVSWLNFNYRILDLANRGDIPLYERLKFIAITEANLNEFKMVRLGYISEKIKGNIGNSNNLSPEVQYQNMTSHILDFMNTQKTVYDNVMEELKDKVEIVTSKKEMSSKEKKFVNSYFDDYVFSGITPLTLDSGKEFPKIKSNSINILGSIKCESNENLLFIIKIPSHLDRVVSLGNNRYILLEDIILSNMKKIFIGKKVKDTALFRVSRNVYGEAEVMYKEGKLIDRMRANIKSKENGEVLILEHTPLTSKLTKELYNQFGDYIDILNEEDIIDKTFLFSLYGMLDSENKYPDVKGRKISELLIERDIFKALDKGDIVLHHPYQSFQPVVKFIQDAAIDPKVISIKQTLYRVSNNSPIVKALERASQNGKQVTVFIEVKARFSETDNIEWVSRLEDAGCDVIYGIEDYKVHSKITVITKRCNNGKLKSYAHIGTGNYNEKTSEIYTDISLLTSSKKVCSDISRLFNVLTGYSNMNDVELNRVLYAPINLKSRILELIDKSIDEVIYNKNPEITIKCNSIENREVIDRLYQAAEEGVKINLIVRGICCIKARPNLTIKSIVGKYLEHSRIYKFSNNDESITLISSADLMSRNLDRRFEVGLELSKSNQAITDEILRLCMDDTFNSYEMNKYGEYIKVKNDSINCHVKFEEYAKEQEVLVQYNKFD